MGYDWDDKREVCYRLYVEERKPLEDVVAYFKGKLDFVPSKRTFQTQFRRWGFPSKLDYSHKDEAVVQRVREMWEKNVMQRDMLPVLHAEGFNVTESGLTRLRAKHNMHLKSANGSRAGMDGDESLMDSSAVEDTSHPLDILSGLDRRFTEEPITPISQRRERVRKRKRVTEGAGDGGIESTPRYPSETTIGDAQKFLGLDENMYREVREHFQAICEQRGIIKKTICRPERWEAAKGQLVQDLPYLQQRFMASDASTLPPLTLSLDIISMDVTKNMRVKSKAMTLAEAKNLLGLNPLLARVLKTKLINILRANDFVNTYESDNWEGLKEQWLEQTGLKAKIPTEDCAERDRVLKAIQLVCRDTLKRWREAQRVVKVRASGSEGNVVTAEDDMDQSAFAAELLQHSNAQHISPATPSATASTSAVPRKVRRGRPPAAATTAAAAAAAAAAATVRAAQEARIDPSLLQAATSSNTPDDAQTEQQPENSSSSSSSQQQQGTYPGLPSTADDKVLVPSAPPLAVFFRRGTVAGDGQQQGVPPLWLGALGSRSLAGLHKAALGFAGGSRYGIVKMEGIVGAGAAGGSAGELLYQIDADDELQGYLVHSEGSKASFVVHLAYGG